MHVLITDDLFTNRIQIGIVLKSMGYTYDQASNGDQAIALILEKDYDLILMDIEMPVRNGLETVAYIRNEMEGYKRDVPVIAITAHDPSDYFDHFMDQGFDGLINKPVNELKILQIIDICKKVKRPT